MTLGQGIAIGGIWLGAVIIAAIVPVWFPLWALMLVPVMAYAATMAVTNWETFK